MIDNNALESYSFAIEHIGSLKFLYYEGCRLYENAIDLMGKKLKVKIFNDFDEFVGDSAYCNRNKFFSVISAIFSGKFPISNDDWHNVCYKKCLEVARRLDDVPNFNGYGYGYFVQRINTLETSKEINKNSDTDNFFQCYRHPPRDPLIMLSQSEFNEISNDKYYKEFLEIINNLDEKKRKILSDPRYCSLFMHYCYPLCFDAIYHCAEHFVKFGGYAPTFICFICKFCDIDRFRDYLLRFKCSNEYRIKSANKEIEREVKFLENNNKKIEKEVKFLENNYEFSKDFEDESINNIFDAKFDDIDIGDEDVFDDNFEDLNTMHDNICYDKICIEDMDLSVRSYNCLKTANIHTVKDLIKLTKSDLLKIKNCGKKTLDEVILKLKNYGLFLKDDEE